MRTIICNSKFSASATLLLSSALAPAVALADTRVGSLVDTENGIEELVTTISPHGKTADEIAGSINILDQQALQREAAATLGETLKNQLGVHSSSFGPGVGVPVIRGQSGGRVEIVQNGQTIGDASSVSADHAIATEPLLASRIEVIRGPATLRYGPGAIGGVINVIDDKIHQQAYDGFSALAETRFNFNNDEHATVGRLDYGNGPLSLHLDGIYRDSDNIEIPGLANPSDADDSSNGFIENSNRQAESWSFGLAWNTDNFHGGFSLTQLDNNYGIPPGSHADEPVAVGMPAEEEASVRIDLEQSVFSVELAWRNSDLFINSLSTDFNYTDYEHQELEITTAETEVGTQFDVDAYEWRAELTHQPIGNWLGAAGLQYNQTDFSAVGEEAFVPPSETQRIGLFWLEENELPWALLELGLRWDQQQISTTINPDIDHSTINGNASLLIPVGEHSQFSVLLSHAERAPSAEELLSNGEHVATQSAEFGSVDLNNESAFNTELSWFYQNDTNDFSVKTTLFNYRYQDYIYLANSGTVFDAMTESCVAANTATGDSTPCFNYQQEGARFTGLEGEISGRIAQFEVRAWGDLVRARLSQSGNIPRIPPARIGLDATYDYQQWLTKMSITHAYAQNKVATNESRTAAYTRLDWYLSYAFGEQQESSLFIKASNLTDEDIRNSTSFLRDSAPEPGRAISMGIRYKF